MPTGLELLKIRLVLVGGRADTLVKGPDLMADTAKTLVHLLRF